jgi:hypothetical protein
LLISQRTKPGGLAGHLAYGAWNEAEDVLATVAGTEIAVLDRDTHSRSIRVRRLLGRGVRRVAGPQHFLPATRSTPVVGQSEHIFFIAHGVWDLPLLEQLRSLRGQAGDISVWISEVWPSELEDRRLLHECYSMVDHLFVPHEEVLDSFRDLAPHATVQVLPPAADVLRFAPSDAFGDRGIAVLGIGRRDPAQHSAILDWARRTNTLYLYDTVRGQAVDWVEHREALADHYRHANVAICNYAKFDVPELIGGLRATPGRLFEGLAAGSILIGVPPDEEQQRLLFGQTVVEELDGSPQQLSQMLDRLTDQAEIRRLRMRNLVLACRGHDWGHRWKSAFEAIGIDVPFGLENRLDTLSKKGDEYEELAERR